MDDGQGPDDRTPGETFDADSPVSEAEFQVAYEELRKRAWGLKRRFDLPTWNPTALVHEAYVRLAQSETFRAKSRAHLMATLANAMEFVLVDAVRRIVTVRRGHERPVPLDDASNGPAVDPRQILAIHLTLRSLAADHPEEVRVLRLEYFGGLSHDEVADVLGVSSRTVGRIMKRAKALVRKALASQPGEGLLGV